jgi:hypothetical protein
MLSFSYVHAHKNANIEGTAPQSIIAKPCRPEIPHHEDLGRSYRRSYRAFVGYTRLLRERRGVDHDAELENAKTSELIVLEESIDWVLANRMARDLEAHRRGERGVNRIPRAWLGHLPMAVSRVWP